MVNALWAPQQTDSVEERLCEFEGASIENLKSKRKAA
jgi:hypothetical protein